MQQKHRRFSLWNPFGLFFQISVAAILTVVYAIVQMIVLVGIIIQIADEPCSPNALFFYFVTATFIIAGLLHPTVGTANLIRVYLVFINSSSGNVT